MPTALDLSVGAYGGAANGLVDGPADGSAGRIKEGMKIGNVDGLTMEGDKDGNSDGLRKGIAMCITLARQIVNMREQSIIHNPSNGSEERIKEDMKDRAELYKSLGQSHWEFDLVKAKEAAIESCCQ